MKIAINDNIYIIIKNISAQIFDDVYGSMRVSDQLDAAGQLASADVTWSWFYVNLEDQSMIAGKIDVPPQTRRLKLISIILDNMEDIKLLNTTPPLCP